MLIISYYTKTLVKIRVMLVVEGPIAIKYNRESKHLLHEYLNNYMLLSKLLDKEMILSYIQVKKTKHLCID